MGRFSAVTDAASPPPRHRHRRRGLLFALIAVGAVGLTGCRLPTFGMYTGATTQGQSTFHLWQGFMIGGFIVWALIWGLIGWVVFRYRKRKDDDVLPKQTRYNVFWEAAYTITPILAVAVLFAFTILVENKVDLVKANPAVQVRVTAFQWGWRFDYTGQNVSVYGNYDSYPTMEVPAHETVRVTLVSNDVVHGFYVRGIDFSRYAQPGVTNKFDMDFSRTGRLTGQCTQYCGLYHAEMRFFVNVVSPADYHRWLLGQQAKAATAA